MANELWTDLSNIGMNQKTILKSDGTSTYTSQDLGTAQMRYNDYQAEKVVYVVGDEQISHFQGVFEILKRLKRTLCGGLISFGLRDGRFTNGSNEITRRHSWLIADDLVEEVIQEAKLGVVERGELADLSPAEQADTFRKIGLGALKIFHFKGKFQKTKWSSTHKNL